MARPRASCCAMPRRSHDTSSSVSGSSVWAPTGPSSPTVRAPCCGRLEPDMTRYAAFLRAINVGGHTIRMVDLKASIQALGFENVETFIASGNVIFDTPDTDEGKLEATIERALEAD